VKESHPALRGAIFVCYDLFEYAYKAASYDNPALRWTLVSFMGDNPVILGWKFATAMDYLLSPVSASTDDDESMALHNIKPKRWCSEYLTSAERMESGWILRCHLSSPSPSSIFDIDIDLVLSSAEETYSVLSCLEISLNKFVTRDLDPNFHFSPAPLYESVRQQCQNWQHAAMRPVGLAEMTQSFSHQLRALDWMLCREFGSLGAHTHVDACQEEYESLWIPIAGTYSYSPALQKVSRNIASAAKVSFSEPRGGILADEMGMGKTVEVISLVLSRRQAVVSESSSSACPKVVPPGNIDGLSCYCTAEERMSTPKVKESQLVQCAFCKQFQHVVCVSYDPSHPDPMYACPNCGFEAATSEKVDTGDEKSAKKRQLVPLGSTLIVCPDSILPQWESELKRHVAEGILNCVTFTGKVPRFSGLGENASIAGDLICRAEQFRRFDVVLTTYEVMSDGLRRLEATLGQKRRERRDASSLKYRVMPSPLIGSFWYRVCFDESQMLGDGATRAASLALGLNVRFRWAVSGTPISRSVGDVFGLMLFLDMQPYNDRAFFRRVLELPLDQGQKRAFSVLDSLLRRVMWRSEKRDLSSSELQMPGLEECVHEVVFTEVEKYMYQRRWKFCEEKLVSALHRQQDGKLKETHVAKLVDDLLTLRMACCHPQLGQQTGLKTIAEVGILSAPAVFKQLIHQARLQAEDKQRTRVYYLHGLAALEMAEEHWQRAAKLYREVLDGGGDYDLHTDYSNLLHARHNLIEAIHMYLPEITDETQVQALKKEMKDAQLQIDNYKERYIADAKDKLESTTRAYANSITQMTTENAAMQRIEREEIERQRQVRLKEREMQIRQEQMQKTSNQEHEVAEDGQAGSEAEVKEGDESSKPAVDTSTGIELDVDHGANMDAQSSSEITEEEAKSEVQGEMQVEMNEQVQRTVAPSHSGNSHPIVNDIQYSSVSTDTNGNDEGATEKGGDSGLTSSHDLCSTSPSFTLPEDGQPSHDIPSSSPTPLSDSIEEKEVRNSAEPVLPSGTVSSPKVDSPSVSSVWVEVKEKELPIEEGLVGFTGFLDSEVLPCDRIDPDYWISRKDSWWRISLELLDEELMHDLLERLRADFHYSVHSSALVDRMSLSIYLSERLKILNAKMMEIDDQVTGLCGAKAIEFSVAPPPLILALVDRETCPRCVSRKLATDMKRVKYAGVKRRTGGGGATLCIWCRLHNLNSDLNSLLTHFNVNDYLSILSSIHRFMERPEIYPKPKMVLVQQAVESEPPLIPSESNGEVVGMDVNQIQKPEVNIGEDEVDIEQVSRRSSRLRHQTRPNVIEKIVPKELSDTEPLVRLTRRLGGQICEAGKIYLHAVDVLKRRVTLVDRICDAHLEYSNYGEDLTMMMTRMQLHPEQGFAEPKYAQTLFHRWEIPSLRAEYEAGYGAAQYELQEQLSQLKYLSKQADEMLSATCPICWDSLPSEIVLLPCGHSGCPNCFKQALVNTPKCPLCRVTVNRREDAKLVSRDAGIPELPSASAANDMNRQWGSKIEAIITLVQDTMVKCPGEKILLFSHWQSVLNLITKALKEAKVTVLNACNAGETFSAALDQFRQDANITILCLPLNRGSKGANLMCASHIIFAEPSLLTASEAQAIGRIHRLGQTKTMFIHRFYVSGSIEQSIFELSKMRQATTRNNAAVGFGIAEKETNFLDIQTLENLLRGKPITLDKDGTMESSSSNAFIDIDSHQL